MVPTEGSLSSSPPPNTQIGHSRCHRLLNSSSGSVIYYSGHLSAFTTQDTSQQISCPVGMLWVPVSKSSHPVTWSFTNTSQTFQLKSLSFCLMYRGRMSFTESLLVTSSILTCLNISLFFPTSWKIWKFRSTVMFYQHFEGINHSALWLLFLCWEIIISLDASSLSSLLGCFAVSQQ